MSKTENLSIREQLDENMGAFILSKNMCASDLYDDPGRGNGEGLRHDLAQSLSLLLDKVDHLIFSSHWYSESIETEQITFPGNKKITMDDLFHDSSIIRPDELFEITGQMKKTIVDSD